MGKHKKPFIDRKSAVSFRLLHRSQKDPLIADESLGERVLDPVSSDAKKLEERRKFGVYYRDDYDYLRHLKEVGETVDLIGDEPIVEREVIGADDQTTSKQFNSCIFETHGVELRVGMLNRAAPSNELLPDFDPDIVAALDGEIDNSGADDDDELDDDFVAKANAPGGKDDDKLFDYRNENRGKEEILQRFGLRNAREKFSDESSADEEDDETDSSATQSEVDERKTTFTNYSMSSSVIKRPEGLRLIDDHFETLYEEQYAKEEEENGAEGTDGGGQMGTDSAHFLSLLAEEQSQRSCAERFQRELPDSELKGSVLRYAKAMEIGKGRAEPTEDILVDSAKRSRWDCESILSMHSTLYNHPTEIREAMKGIGRRRGRTTKEKGMANLEEMEIDGDQRDGPPAPSVRTRISMISSIRPKGETTEERRTRKSAVKEERRERRKEKKANKETFRAERLKLEAQRKTNQPKTRPMH
ncbi:hypothetical protein niasHT_001265 [Heterodera trifolii]|uniref:Protein LTV1 homolog n=1 Tax=Heterodera trifolii TaxID=157864 RepID=A0ABD2M6A7_9BILA